MGREKVAQRVPTKVPTVHCVVVSSIGIKKGFKYSGVIAAALFVLVPLVSPNWNPLFRNLSPTICGVNF